MDPRILDILRYVVLLVVLLVVTMFGLKHYNRYEERKEIVAALQGATSDSSFYRQFEAEDAKKTLLECIALIHRAGELGVTPTQLFDRVYQRKGSDDFGGYSAPEYPVKEKLVRDALTAAYQACERLEILDPTSIRDLREGRMPSHVTDTPVILPLIDPELSPGIEKIIPNLEIFPGNKAGKNRELSSIEISAARRLARDLASAGLIEKTVSQRIIDHYTTPKKEDEEDEEEPTKK
ncbi:MAG: hypothetical protein AAGI48_00370 [Verrucomicrobiota bacterium]